MMQASFAYVLAVLLISTASLAQGDSPPKSAEVIEAPEPQQAVLREASTYADLQDFAIASPAAIPPTSSDYPKEKFHWTGLIMESIAFDSLQNSVRVMMATQHDRHLLLNKPFWSDYWASLEEFNWRRWNDGDSIKVNYIGHPMEGAIAGYLEVQNNPRDRSLRITDTPEYWHSRLHSFAWSAVYSSQWELGPLGESAIFNQGGFTYPIQCNPSGCNASSKYTNNTGWVDLIVTPVIGTLWLVGEDAIDAFITDPLVRRHPHNFGLLMLRSGVNPPRSLANMLRGRYPWYRDYEHLPPEQSGLTRRLNNAVDEVPAQHADLFLFFESASFPSPAGQVPVAATWQDGGGIQLGIHVLRYLDLTVATTIFPPLSISANSQGRGPLLSFAFGIRSGFDRRRYSLRAGLAPGFVSSPQDLGYVTSNRPHPSRYTNFQWVGMVSAEVKVSSHLGARFAVQNTVVRYKSDQRDPDGIGSPPSLYFLSHDNYVNSTNWGLKVGPVIRF